MKITITPEDAKNQKGYLSQSDCLLATAIKRQIPDIKSLRVFGHSVDINGKYYYINQTELIHESYAGFKQTKSATVKQPFDIELIEQIPTTYP
jgi:hypothetical protein